MVSTARANQKIKPAVLTKQLRRKDYRTRHIIDLVNEVLETDKDDTEAFAQEFTRNEFGLRDLFNFVDLTFRYVEDPKFNQWVQTPSYMYWVEKEGDCKSFTVFISSVLSNMGIPHIIRYVAYGTKDVKHVYPVALLNGRQIPMDVVYKKQQGGRFGTEKPYTKKIDFKVEGF